MPVARLLFFHPRHVNSGSFRVAAGAFYMLPSTRRSGARRTAAAASRQRAGIARSSPSRRNVSWFRLRSQSMQMRSPKRT